MKNTKSFLTKKKKECGGSEVEKKNGYGVKLATKHTESFLATVIGEKRFN